MNYLFLDNFRGFKDTYLPLQDVNFLVGENSTGKTSFLGILKLFTSPHFWFSSNFDYQDLNFGNFKDMVSIHSKSRSSFRVGFLREIESKKVPKKSFEGALLTFVEKEGMPALSRFTFNRDRVKIDVRILKNKVRYKEEKEANGGRENSNSQDFFQQWVKSYGEDGGGFKDLKFDEKYFSSALQDFSSLPIPFLISSIARASNKKGIEHLDVMEVLSIWDKDIAWIAPIRTKAKRTYDEYNIAFSPEGEHTPYRIKKILDSKIRSRGFVESLRKFGRASGLFDAIEIKRFGKSITSPFELDVVINRKAISVDNVGYGVSQSLPVIVELITRAKGCWYAIQQPEIHLHPRAQAALGDVIFNLTVNEDKVFFVETHSDFTIDRFRINCKKKRGKKPKGQILFFEKVKDGNKVTPIQIKEDGGLSSEQPSGYRNFFIKEEMKLLGL